MAAKKPKVDPRALELKALRIQLAELQKAADGLKADLVKDYGLGAHEGFVILEKTRRLIDQELLAVQLGDLEPFKSPSTAIHIEFPKSAA